jgi:hypothetical protein
VDLLANAEKISEEEYIILKLAAIFLFSGYINDYLNPQDSAFRAIETILPGYGFEKADIDNVKRLIQNSFTDTLETKADHILHDARYDYLGRVDFIVLTDKLLREESEHKQSLSREKWIEKQRKLVSEHDFKTETARLLRNIKTEDQLTLLKDY